MVFKEKGIMPEIYKHKILNLLKHKEYSPQKIKRLADTLDIPEEDYEQFKEDIEDLAENGQIVVSSNDAVSLPPMAGKIVGTFRGKKKGFGFVVPLDPTLHGDLFIPAKKTKGAMTGDTVVAKVSKKKKKKKEMLLSGRIVDILERAHDRFVGTLKKTSEGWIVIPDGTAFTEPVVVEDVSAKNAKKNQKVVVEILQYPTRQFAGQGVITKVLGKAGKYDSEIQSVIHQYHIPEEFDKECLDQAGEMARSYDPEDKKDREDITDKVIVTIDPPDSKDFDDAISLEFDKEGNYVLGVHIADVSNFVTQGSALDEEAQERGNSVYLPEKTIPMLPEILSNGVCSLQPDKNRYAKSVYITYDHDANILNRRYTNSMIRSSQRLTYHQADAIIKKKNNDFDQNVIDLMKNMEKLSRRIEARRYKEGMLHLDIPEMEIIFDEKGQVTGAQKADDSYPHTIIEMFMVEANEAVAHLFDKKDIPFMRRIHPSPDPLSMKSLARLLKSFGLDFPKEPSKSDLQKLLDSVKEKEYSLAVNLMVLRSFERAVYSPLEMGHWALASTNYCHFTSPIRRYADLMVHRLLDSHIKGQLKGQDSNAVVEKDELKKVGEHISFTEQRAEDAERDLKEVMILHMLKRHIGDELDCVITGLTNFGIFAESKRYGIEGLIDLGDLGPDRWNYNPKTNCVKGQRSGLKLHLGRPLKCKIVSVNLPARQLSLAPKEPLVSKPSKKKRKKGKKSRRKGKKNKRKSNRKSKKR